MPEPYLIAKLQAAGIATFYFDASYWGKPRGDVGDSEFPFWKIRADCGKVFTDHLVFYMVSILRDTEEPQFTPPYDDKALLRLTPQVFIYNALVMADHVIDNNSEKLPVIQRDLMKSQMYDKFISPELVKPRK